MVTINGNKEEASGMTVLEYLNRSGFKAERVVVEINFEIIPKELLSEIVLKDDDSVEILNFVGGG